jgi:hypothetical protein
MLTSEQACAKLMGSSRDELFSIVYDSYKDQYNTRPRHMYNYTVAELTYWYLNHYRWNVEEQFWESKVPFTQENYFD